MHSRQNIPGGRKTEKGLLHKTRNEREKCESPYSYAFFGRSVPGKAFSICINYCVFIDPEGGALEMIIHDKGEIGGPLNQFSTIGYKFETNGATILYPERLLRVMSTSSFSAVDEIN